MIFRRQNAVSAGASPLGNGLDKAHDEAHDQAHDEAPVGEQVTGQVAGQVSSRNTDEGESQLESRLETEAHDEAHEAHDEAHDLADTDKRILEACAAKSTPELLEILGYRTRTGNFKRAMNRLCEELKLLEPTLPDAARSKNQKYRLTPKGAALLEKVKHG